MCQRCNNTGILGIRNGDDDISCPDCENEIVAEYTHRYRYPYLLIWLLETDRRAFESARDDAWYRAGWYEILGYDRHGRTYITVDSEQDDSEFEDDRIERELADDRYHQKWGE